MFTIPLTYDEPSAKTRLNARLKFNLCQLLARHNKRYDECYLRVSNNSKTHVARGGATFVLQEGQITSPICFSLASSVNNKRRITPHGWKTATLGYLVIFIGECRIMNNAMHYRFAIVDNAIDDDGGISEVAGEWELSIHEAFAHVQSLYAAAMPEETVIWSKLNKDMILAVHANRIQNMLWSNWQVLKMAMTPQDLAMAHHYETAELGYVSLERPSILPYIEALIKAKNAQQPTNASMLEIDPPANPFGILNALELLTIFTMVENCVVQFQAVAEVLYLLEAGLGTRMDWLCHFLTLIERVAWKVWSSVLQRGLTLQHVYTDLLEYCERTVENATLDTRAVVFVFTRIELQYPTLDLLQQERDFNVFVNKLTQLPRSEACKACFTGLFGTYGE